MATIGALLTRVQQYGFGTDSSVAQLEFANQELREIYLARPWQWREGITNLTCAASSYAVALTAGMGAVQNVHLVDGTTTAYPLDYLDPDDFRTLELENVPGVNSRPTYWTRWGNGLRLFPRPDKVYTVAVDALSVPTADIATGTECPLPYEFEDILVYGILYRMAVRQRDQSLSEWAYGKRNEVFAICARDDDERQRAREEKVKQADDKWSDWNDR